MELIEEKPISKAKLKKLANDTVRSAEAANLEYVSDQDAGIERIRRRGKFIYQYRGKEIKDESTLQRIKQLVLPPAWEKVWICANEHGHLQATGYDVKNRKQYKYHPLWNALRSQTKYFHLLEFGKALPNIRKQVQADLAQKELTQTKVLALVLSLMQCTCIRIGNSMYEKLNGSFGLTTLKDKHVNIEGSKINFRFKGKKGVYHNISLRSKKLARMVQACKDIPGKELFQYYENGERHSIDSGMVNNYIKEISSGNFTAKDFRTWSGTLLALEYLRTAGFEETETALKKKIVEMLDAVAKQLGNTRAVCKKYYVHPTVIEMYTNQKLKDFFEETSLVHCDSDETALSQDEQLLLKILE